MLVRTLTCLACLQLTITCSWGEIIFLTTDATETIGGTSIRDGDIARYDTIADTATVVFSEDLFSANETIDAFQVIANGNFLLSTDTSATLGGLSFDAGDIVSYNPFQRYGDAWSSSAALFSGTEDVDAFHQFSDGTLLDLDNDGRHLGWAQL